MIAVRRRLARNIALVATVVAVSPLLAGCWQGFGANTTMQNSMNSGNGTQEIVGSLRVDEPRRPPAVSFVHWLANTPR